MVGYLIHFQRAMTNESGIQSAFFIPYLLISATIMISNTVLIHSIRKLQKLKSVSWRFIFALSVSDTCYGVVIAINSIAYTVMEEKLYKSTLRIGAVPLLFIIGCFSYFMIFCITIDRFIHIKFALRYSVIMTVRKSKFFIFSAIVASLGVACIQLIGYRFGFYEVTLTCASALSMTCLIVIQCLYFNAYMSLSNRTQSISSKRETTQQRSASKSFSKAVLLTLLSLSICCLPYLFLKPTQYYFPKDTRITFAAYLAEAFLYANSFLNAMIMIYLDNGLRKSVRKFVVCCSRQVASQDSQLRRADSKR